MEEKHDMLKMQEESFQTSFQVLNFLKQSYTCLLLKKSAALPRFGYGLAWSQKKGPGQKSKQKEREFFD